MIRCRECRCELDPVKDVRYTTDDATLCSLECVFAFKTARGFA
jgi:hypothetical protein